MPITKPFDQNHQRYEEWFEKHEHIYKSELKAIKRVMPQFEHGLEIGVGSGRFAKPLNIQDGVEPSDKMRKVARKKGLNVMKGTGENLPVLNNVYDLCLLVTTICFLDDIHDAFSEIDRILTKDGNIVLGFVDKNSPIGQKYRENKQNNVFYKDANFYSTETVVHLLHRHNFKINKIKQTVFGDLKVIDNVHKVKDGYGEGSFVSIRASKDNKNNNLKPKEQNYEEV